MSMQLAFDPGAHTGWVACEAGRVQSFGIITPAPSASTPFDRWLSLWERSRDLLAGFPVEGLRVGIEEWERHVNPLRVNTMRISAGYCVALLCACAGAGVRPEAIRKQQESKGRARMLGDHFGIPQAKKWEHVCDAVMVAVLAGWLK